MPCKLLIKNTPTSKYDSGDVIGAYAVDRVLGTGCSKAEWIAEGRSAESFARHFVVVNVLDMTLDDPLVSQLLENTEVISDEITLYIRNYNLNAPALVSDVYTDLAANAETTTTKAVLETYVQVKA